MISVFFGFAKSKLILEMINSWNMFISGPIAIINCKMNYIDYMTIACFQKCLHFTRSGARVAWLGGGGTSTVFAWGHSLVEGKTRSCSVNLGSWPQIQGRKPKKKMVFNLSCDWTLWCGCRFLPTDSGVKTKKKDHCYKILGFAMTCTRIFVLKQKFAYARGGHKQYFWEAQASKCALVAPGLLLYFGAQSSLGEHNSRLEGGTSSELGRVRTQNGPMAAGLHFTSLQTP